MSRARIDNEDELYLHTIPYCSSGAAAAAFTGERAAIPGIQYPPEENALDAPLRAIWKHYQANPNGPHSYGWWIPVPAGLKPAHHARWLKQYSPLVEEGTWRGWRSLTPTCSHNRRPGMWSRPLLPPEFYVVLANYGRSAVEVRPRTFTCRLATPVRRRQELEPRRPVAANPAAASRLIRAQARRQCGIPSCSVAGRALRCAPSVVAKNRLIPHLSRYSRRAAECAPANPFPQHALVSTTIAPLPTCRNTWPLPDARSFPPSHESPELAWRKWCPTVCCEEWLFWPLGGQVQGSQRENGLSGNFLPKVPHCPQSLAPFLIPKD